MVYGSLTWDLGKGLSFNENQWVRNHVTENSGKATATAYWKDTRARIHWYDGEYYCNAPVKEETIGQFTGLKDKNGVEIYENDIVKALNTNPSNYQIEFIEGGFCLTNQKLEDYNIDINMMYPSIGCQIEVIGNIHKNEEPLK